MLAERVTEWTKQWEQQGLEKGIEEGMEKAKLEDARNIHHEGIAIDIIVRVTGLPRGRIETLIEEE